MAYRLLAVLALALMLTGGILGLSRCSDPVLRSASGLAGERWYRLMIKDQQVGFMHTNGRRARTGRWTFSSDLRFVLSPGNPVRVRELLVFDPYPPYPLRRAEQWTERSGDTAGTLIRLGPDGYETATVQHIPVADGERPAVPATTDSQSAVGTNWQPAAWDYDMTDYLAFESWLLRDQPPAGSSRVVATLDFDRRRVVPRVFRVEAHNATGFVVEHAAPFDHSRMQLDRHMAPLTMTISGLFELQRVPAAVALAPRTALQVASYFIPTDRALADHQNIVALALEIHGNIPPTSLWPNLLADDQRTLLLTTNTLSGVRERRAALRDTAEFPVADPRMRALAAQAVGTARRPAEQIAALTGFVHRYLTYQEGADSRHVLALLDEPRGDCSEFADLLTTLARSLGIPSRTIFGLAYSDATVPAFRFHAWNEVFIDGIWRAVDPTWNQLAVDATHIPLPADTATALRLLTGAADLRFTVRDVRYRGD